MSDDGREESVEDTSEGIKRVAESGRTIIETLLFRGSSSPSALSKTPSGFPPTPNTPTGNSSYPHADTHEPSEYDAFPNTHTRNSSHLQDDTHAPSESNDERILARGPFDSGVDSRIPYTVKSTRNRSASTPLEDFGILAPLPTSAPLDYSRTNLSDPPDRSDIPPTPVAEVFRDTNPSNSRVDSQLPSTLAVTDTQTRSPSTRLDGTKSGAITSSRGPHYKSYSWCPSDGSEESNAAAAKTDPTGGPPDPSGPLLPTDQSAVNNTTRLEKLSDKATSSLRRGISVIPTSLTHKTSPVSKGKHEIGSDKNSPVRKTKNEIGSVSDSDDDSDEEVYHSYPSSPVSPRSPTDTQPSPINPSRLPPLIEDSAQQWTRLGSTQRFDNGGDGGRNSRSTSSVRGQTGRNRDARTRRSSMRPPRRPDDRSEKKSKKVAWAESESTKPSSTGEPPPSSMNGQGVTVMPDGNEASGSHSDRSILHPRSNDARGSTTLEGPSTEPGRSGGREIRADTSGFDELHNYYSIPPPHPLVVSSARMGDAPEPISAAPSYRTVAEEGSQIIDGIWTGSPSRDAPTGSRPSMDRPPYVRPDKTRSYTEGSRPISTVRRSPNISNEVSQQSEGPVLKTGPQVRSDDKGETRLEAPPIDDEGSDQEGWTDEEEDQNQDQDPNQGSVSMRDGNTGSSVLRNLLGLPSKVLSSGLFGKKKHRESQDRVIVSPNSSVNNVDTDRIEEGYVDLGGRNPDTADGGDSNPRDEIETTGYDPLTSDNRQSRRGLRPRRRRPGETGRQTSGRSSRALTEDMSTNRPTSPTHTAPATEEVSSRHAYPSPYSTRNVDDPNDELEQNMRNLRPTGSTGVQQSTDAVDESNPTKGSYLGQRPYLDRSEQDGRTSRLQGVKSRIPESILRTGEYVEPSRRDVNSRGNRRLGSESGINDGLTEQRESQEEEEIGYPGISSEGSSSSVYYSPSPDSQTLSSSRDTRPPPPVPRRQRSPSRNISPFRFPSPPPLSSFRDPLSVHLPQSDEQAPTGSRRRRDRGDETFPDGDLNTNLDQAFLATPYPRAQEEGTRSGIFSMPVPKLFEGGVRTGRIPSPPPLSSFRDPLSVHLPQRDEHAPTGSRGRRDRGDETFPDGDLNTDHDQASLATPYPEAQVEGTRSGIFSMPVPELNQGDVGIGRGPDSSAYSAMPRSRRYAPFSDEGTGQDDMVERGRSPHIRRSLSLSRIPSPPSLSSVRRLRSKNPSQSNRQSRSRSRGSRARGDETFPDGVLNPLASIFDMPVPELSRSSSARSASLPNRSRRTLTMSHNPRDDGEEEEEETPGETGQETTPEVVEATGWKKKTGRAFGNFWKEVKDQARVNEDDFLGRIDAAKVERRDRTRDLYVDGERYSLNGRRWEDAREEFFPDLDPMPPYAADRGDKPDRRHGGVVDPFFEPPRKRHPDVRFKRRVGAK
ncbi:hypothetical protein M231_02738 [Tremella mesenterica]|uniref:Uncharacterized protein n=1 Tax=Tremella mesenterica TaxID=5217 RepID=A0A4Q1BPY4_TREME|nr:uncharacterized protein TREMEDRAFT_73769 [Tremella mesenterica DSM 1558]EIW70233.1 hypothetical protein TREMEDRAFT_73769 [Tremella mesenterica DSM 1558]RXK39943.1 hypothetical protein M231_02738 [Tremella mesenterica]